MSGFLTHRTKAGDRWDLLAHEYYGDAFAVDVLLEANPGHAGLAALPSGLALRVPLVEARDVKPEQRGATPWR